ncbi:Phage tail protein [Lysobacter dokdonensis DS-58]|uniref:Phage tail protein n=1 Tax=Lysobacter dokdonensis DS-58 TaxID=1300345 RepID=A0A0A2WGQ8_9GAMM|nr:phage tail protein [Lysobacter dokdonensis]KGQ19371.1 Phage tail protein [Lysobacter dokdonensis DS-58]
MNGTSLLLGAGYPWYSDTGAAQRAIVANAVTGLSLATLPDGAMGLASSDDSLGRLTLPRGVAIDDPDVYVLSEDGSLVYRYDAVRATLVPLEHVGAQGLRADADASEYLEPRRFRGATAIAIAGGALYVADPLAHRVQVFDLRTLALLRMHGPFVAPVDLAASARAVYILDRGAGRVYRADPESDCVTLVADPDDVCRARHWDRIAVDNAERVHLRYRHDDSTELDVFETQRCPGPVHASERVYDSEQVRDRFTPPLITSDGRGGLDLPERLLDPCKLRQPLADSVSRWEIGDTLYVADPATRKLVVHLADGRVRHRFGAYDANGERVSADHIDAWLPAEVVALDGCAIILDARHQVVYAHRTGEAQLRRLFGASSDSTRRWRRMAGDAHGCLLLWDIATDSVDRVDLRGKPLGTMPLRDAKAAFDRPRSTRQPAKERRDVRLTRSGAIPRPANAPPAWPSPSHVREGTWISAWLDSDLYNCVWDVIELSVARLPQGARIRMRTRTSNTRGEAEDGATAIDPTLAGSWRDAPMLAAPAQPDPTAPATFSHRVLVPSPPGQYLQLQIVLEGDGASTPLVRHARLRFPRDSLLRYLPAIYSAPPAQQEFLDRFLSIAQTTWASIEREVDTFERFLDPDSVPDDALPYLAAWLDVRLEGTWTPAQNRRLLKAMPALRARWGTLGGMRDWLRVYIGNLAGIPEADLEAMGVPGIVEGFVERRRLRLNGNGATLCQSQALWSPAVERRMQIGVFDRLGDVELVSTGDPERDVFQHFAHAFRVYVPSSMVRTPEQEAVLRRAVEAQKPAHATYQLVLVEPRLSLDDQSTLDLDTVIGGARPIPLRCFDDRDAPSLPPRQRLGFDTTLA